MWVRTIEFMLGCWLALSPFILRYPSHETFLWSSDLTCAGLIIVFSLLSFYPPLSKMHLFNLGVAFWLLGLGYATFPEIALPPQENSVSIALLIFMLALIPTHSHIPPQSWVEFLDSRSEREF
jgi:hypothetical protein